MHNYHLIGHKHLGSEIKNYVFILSQKKKKIQCVWYLTILKSHKESKYAVKIMKFEKKNVLKKVSPGLKATKNNHDTKTKKMHSDLTDT